MGGKEISDYTKGDNLLIPFEDDIFIFVKLKGRISNTDSKLDRNLSNFFRRVTLDNFWAIGLSVVSNNLRNVEKMLKISKIFGLSGPFCSECSMDMGDHCGCKVAIGMMLCSIQPGRHSKKFIPFETIRQLRTYFSNFDRVLVSNVHQVLT